MKIDIDKNERHADILKMLESGCTVQEIMQKHNCGYVLIHNIRSTAGIKPHSTGPRETRKPEFTNDGDRAFYSRQNGHCMFCEESITSWIMMGGRKGEAVCLCCKPCWLKASVVIWNDKFFKNMEALRAMHPPEQGEDWQDAGFGINNVYCKESTPTKLFWAERNGTMHAFTEEDHKRLALMKPGMSW